MINEKEKDGLQSKLGKLMIRRVMLVDALNTYSKELKEVDTEVQKVFDKYAGVKDDGGTVQQAQ